MPDDQEKKIIIDDDWKAEAQREKERLAEEADKEQATQAAGEAQGSLFLELLDLLAQQAVIALGGAQLPDGRTIPGNPAAAKHYIDLIGDLEVKTKGNLSKEEAEVLNQLVSRMRWAFSMAAKQPGGAAPSPAPEPGAGGAPGPAPEGSPPTPPSPNGGAPSS